MSLYILRSVLAFLFDSMTQNGTSALSRIDLSKYKCILSDCDGVIWCGNQLIPGVKDAIRKIVETTKFELFLSLTAGQSQDETFTIRSQSLVWASISSSRIAGPLRTMQQ